MHVFAALVDSAPDPADIFALPALRTALIELVLLAIAGGALGVWIVLHRLAFFAHASGTATFPGLVVAEAAGFAPRLAGLAVALLYAAGVHRAGRDRGGPGDVATGLVLVAALAIGVVLASDVFKSGTGVDNLLFGTALGLDGADVAYTAVTAAVALIATVTLGRAWSATAFDAAGARALGLPQRTLDGLLLGFVAVAAVAALPAVGALLVTSTFVVPAAIARLFAREIPRLLVMAITVAIAQSVLGLYLAVWIDVAPGPAIAVLGAATYAICASARALSAKPRRAARAAPVPA